MHNSFIFQQYICYTTPLNTFRAARCSTSGGPIVSPQPLASSASVSSRTVWRWRADATLSTFFFFFFLIPHSFFSSRKQMRVHLCDSQVNFHERCPFIHRLRILMLRHIWGITLAFWTYVTNIPCHQYFLPYLSVTASWSTSYTDSHTIKKKN